MWARRGVVGGLAAAGVLVLAGTASAADVSVAYQVNQQHSGLVSGDSLAPPLVKAWTRNLGATVSYPLVVGGRVFVVTSDGTSGATVYALSESTGKTVWSRTMGGLYASFSLAYDNGTVFIQNFGGALQAVSASTGGSLWAVQLPYQWAFTSPPVARGGVVYTAGAGGGGTLYAVRESDGRLLWTQAVMNGDASSPALSSSGVFVSYAGPQVYGFGLTGTPLWRFAGCCEGGGGTTPVFHGGRLYTRDPTSGDYVLDATTGKLVDTFASSTTPAFSGTTGLFMTSGALVANRTDTGTTRWRFTGDGSLASAPIVINGYAYVGSSADHLYAVNLSTGKGTLQATTPQPILAPDEFNLGHMLTGLGGGGGALIVPAGTTITAYN